LKSGALIFDEVFHEPLLLLLPIWNDWGN